MSHWADIVLSSITQMRQPMVVMVAVGSWPLGHISTVGIVHGDMVENSGLEWGTWLNIVFNLGNVKH